MKTQRIFEISIFTVVLLFVISKWTSDAKNDDLIDLSSYSTVGQVYETYTTFPENKSLKYKYVVGNKIYKAKAESGTTYRHCFADTNDKFKVEYSVSDPSVSRLVLTCKLSDSLELGSKIENLKCIDCN